MSSDPRIARAVAASLEENVDTALEEIDKAISSDRHNARLVLCKARICDRHGMHDEASRLFDLAVSLDTGFAEAYYYRAAADCVSSERKGRVLKDFETAIELNPNYADAFVGASLARLDIGHVVFAIDHARQAVELSPTFGRAYYCLGIALLRVDEYDEAKETLSKSVELTPDFAAAWAGLGKAYYKSNDSSLPLADHALSRAISLTPENPDYRMLRGEIRRDSGDFAAALVDFQQALSLTKPDADVYRSVLHRKISSLPES